MSQNFKRVRDLRIGQFLYFKIKLYNVCEVYYRDGNSCWGPLFTAKFKKREPNRPIGSECDRGSENVLQQL